MLIIANRKSRIDRKPCCGGCAKGRPCCGKTTKPKNRLRGFENRGGILLPRPGLLTPRAMLRDIETLTPRDWRPWLPMFSQQFDMSCMPCCQQGCCFPDCQNFPSPITVSFAGGSNPGCVLIGEWELTGFCELGIEAWGTEEMVGDCGVRLSLSCGGESDYALLIDLNSLDCTVASYGVLFDVVSCDPFELVGVATDNTDTGDSCDPCDCALGPIGDVFPNVTVTA